MTTFIPSFVNIRLAVFELTDADIYHHWSTYFMQKKRNNPQRRSFGENQWNFSFEFQWRPWQQAMEGGGSRKWCQNDKYDLCTWNSLIGDVNCKPISLSSGNKLRIHKPWTVSRLLSHQDNTSLQLHQWMNTFMKFNVTKALLLTSVSLTLLVLYWIQRTVCFLRHKLTHEPFKWSRDPPITYVTNS
jgi:hypothetical protein